MPLHRLILLRHGKAEQRAASGEDFDRDLVERGRAAAAATGRRLAAAGFSPELALVSSAKRALETWRAAAPAFPETRVEETRALYHAGAGEMLSLAEGAEAGPGILVGHNPGLHALALALASGGEADRSVRRALSEGFPTASAAVFRFDEGRPV